MRKAKISSGGFVAALVWGFVASGGALGQGFMVKPMTMDFQARPGETVERVLEIRNTQPDKEATLDVSALLLDQIDNGAWRPVQPEKATEEEKQRLSSCLGWLSLSTRSLTVAPMETGEVTVALKVPRGSRGCYGAALIVQTRPERKPGSIALVVRFLIPVLLEVQGPPARTKVEFPEIGMDYAKATKQRKAGTRLWYRVANSGRTLARLRATLDVLVPAGEGWRRVRSVAGRERRVIPGTDVRINEWLDKELPSGKYKLEARIYVNGRRQRLTTREIEHEGNPAIKRLALDVPLRVDPPVILIETVPGASRSAKVAVENNGTEQVEVEFGLIQPEGLRGVMAGDVKGDDFDCHTWVRVSPSKLLLPGGRRRNVRIAVEHPEGARALAYHYAVLQVLASYPDGQSAGKTDTLIMLKDKRVEPTYRIQGMGMSLAQEEGDSYAIVASFGNTGDAHIEVSCAGRLTDATGMRTVKTFDLGREPGLVLPLSTPRFSGAIDFADVEPGVYLIHAAANFAEKELAQTLPIRVTAEDEGKTVEVIRSGTGAETGSETKPPE